MPLVYRFPPSQGPVSRFLSVLVLVLIFGLAFVVGTFVLLTVLGLVTVLLVVFYLRFWWRRRQWAKRAASGSRKGGVTLEGEYSVSKVEEPRRDDRD
ncbi:MAG: hypothetical protein ACM3ZT_02060 [Bacillota bacterium]